MTVVRRLTEGDGIQLVEDTVLQRLTVAARRDVVAYLADLANGSRVDRGAGVVAFNPLLPYPAGSVGARIKAIITGIGAGQPWADVDALVADLVGRITLAALHADVQAAVNLITADVAVTGSVNARILVEAQNRNTAVQAEVTARGTAISAAVDALHLTVLNELAAGDLTVNARVTTEAAASTGRDTALGARVDTVSARLDTGDIATSLATARSYAYTKAQTDSALAASTSTLRGEITGGDAVVDARVTTESSASAGRDAALGTRVDNVSARLNSGDIATSLAQAASYAYTKAATDSAIAATAFALQAEITSGDATVDGRVTSASSASVGRDNALGTRVDKVSARLDTGDIATSLATANSYAYTKAQSDSATASTNATLRSEFNGADDAIKARLNSGGDIATSLATANSYAYTKAASDSAIASAKTTLRSEFNGADDAIKARLNSGGDIATSLATANSYAYTKAQSDSATASTNATLRSEFNGADDAIKARLNSGGDIATSLATANSYAFTKAESNSAIASTLSTLRAELASGDSTVSAAVATESTTRTSQVGGLQAQYTIKTVATRSDGKKVFGLIGLASTAPNDGTGGESSILLMADKLLFVPSGSVNASPVGFLEVGLVDGVTTLRVPQARIGDLSVSTLKIANNAVTVPLSAYVAGTIMATEIGDTGVATVLTMPSAYFTGAPLSILAGCGVSFNAGNGYFHLIVFEDGTEIFRSNDLVGGQYLMCLPPFMRSPAAGNHVYSMEMHWNEVYGSLSPSYQISRRGMLVLETKK